MTTVLDALRALRADLRHAIDGPRIPARGEGPYGDRPADLDALAEDIARVITEPEPKPKTYDSGRLTTTTGHAFSIEEIRFLPAGIVALFHGGTKTKFIPGHRIHSIDLHARTAEDTEEQDR